MATARLFLRYRTFTFNSSVVTMLKWTATCLAGVEMSQNLTAVREMTGNWPKFREMARKNLLGEIINCTSLLELCQCLVVSCVHVCFNVIVIIIISNELD